MAGALPGEEPTRFKLRWCPLGLHAGVFTWVHGSLDGDGIAHRAVVDASPDRTASRAIAQLDVHPAQPGLARGCGVPLAVPGLGVAAQAGVLVAARAGVLWRRPGLSGEVRGAGRGRTAVRLRRMRCGGHTVGQCRCRWRPVDQPADERTGADQFGPAGVGAPAPFSPLSGRRQPPSAGGSGGAIWWALRWCQLALRTHLDRGRALGSAAGSGAGFRPGSGPRSPPGSIASVALSSRSNMDSVGAPHGSGELPYGDRRRQLLAVEEAFPRRAAVVRLGRKPPVAEPRSLLQSPHLAREQLSARRLVAADPLTTVHLVSPLDTWLTHGQWIGEIPPQPWAGPDARTRPARPFRASAGHPHSRSSFGSVLQS